MQTAQPVWLINLQYLSCPNCAIPEETNGLI